MALVQNWRYQLVHEINRCKETRDLTTYISSQIFAIRIRFDTNCIPKHPRHCVFPKYYNFLPKEFYTTRVCCKVHLGYFASHPGDKGWYEWPSGKDRIQRDVQRSWHQDEVRIASDHWIGCYQVRQCVKALWSVITASVIIIVPRRTCEITLIPLNITGVALRYWAACEIATKDNHFWIKAVFDAVGKYSLQAYKRLRMIEPYIWQEEEIEFRKFVSYTDSKLCL